MGSSSSRETSDGGQKKQRPVALFAVDRSGFCKTGKAGAEGHTRKSKATGFRTVACPYCLQNTYYNANALCEACARKHGVCEECGRWPEGSGEVYERIAVLSELLTSSTSVDVDSAALPSCDGVGARVCFGRRGDARSFSHLSWPSQPFPFVAGADHNLLITGFRSQMELLELIGFERDWVEKKLAGGTEFRLVLFALADCGIGTEDHGLVIDPTWDGLLAFVERESSACASKIKDHVETFKALSFEELVERAQEVENVSAEEYALLSTFEGFAAHKDDSERALS